MNTKIILISLLILIISLPFLVSFLYSIASTCKAMGCDLCGIIAHHINKWINLFTSILISKTQLFLLIIAIVLIILILNLKRYPQKEFVNFKFYKKYKLFNCFNSLLFNPIKRLYAKAIIDPQIYS